MINNPMAISDHFNEVKSRIIKILVVFAIAFSTCYFFKENIFNLLASPLTHILADGQGFIFTHLAEAFFVYLKLALWAALFITVPFALIQLYLFVAPGLYKNEKQFIIPLTVFSVILFYTGISFVYFYLMPTAWNFFLSFAQSGITLQAKISEYFSFTLQLMLAFGLAFQLPILLLILAKVGLITGTMLQKGRKFAILIIAVASALLTPPDIISQIALIIPLYTLYELTILLLKVNKKDKLKK
tara:strand:+ start:7981 stop:8709 length:729 start_codon:yes stop_codon:yes gene_type:complete